MYTTLVEVYMLAVFFFFQAEDGIRDWSVTGVQTCALPIYDMEDRTYKQGIARYTPDEIVDKASKDLAAVAEILGENRYLLGTDRPTSFDAVVFGMTILVYQLREMHPRLTDYARSLPNLTQYIGNLLTEFFPDLDRDV